MADADIKRIKIATEDLPALKEDRKYYFRYRVVSDDKNRFSAWSPIQSVEAPPATATDGQVIQTGTVATGSIITVAWDDQLNKSNYDIFAKYGSGEYSFQGTSRTNSYSFRVTGTGSVTVVVQLEALTKTVDDTGSRGLKVYGPVTRSLV